MGIWYKTCFKCEKSNWCGTFQRNALWLLFGVFLGSFLNNWIGGFSELSINVLKVITGSIVAISVGVATQQFRFNRKQADKANKWNTKQLAMTQMHSSRKVMKECISKLHKCLDISERKNPYKLCEIHAMYGIKLSNGSFCFHGEETDNDIKLIPEKKTEDYTCLEFNKNINGREIKDTIIDYLSEYEYLCSGVNNEIFDNKTVNTLLRGSIIHKYILFKDYIEHQRKYTENESYFSEFTTVARKYKEERDRNNLPQKKAFKS